MSAVLDIVHRLKHAFGYTPATLHCSVCGRARTREVGFISGPGVFFCGTCVRHAATLPSNPNTQGPACRVCKGHRPLVTLNAVDGLRVCVVCVRHMNDMIDDYDARYGTQS